MTERFKAEHTTTIPVVWSVRDTQTDEVVVDSVLEIIARREANQRNMGGEE